MTSPVEQCIYCPNGQGETRDHVPPRSFFPENLPFETHLITVPSCRLCHDRSKRSDSTLRNLFISVRESESNEHVKAGLLAKRDRSFDRDESELLRLLKITQRVRVKTPAGIFLPDDLAFNFDVPMVHAFIERVCRALMWHEFGFGYFRGSFEWRRNVYLSELEYAGIAKFGRVRKVHDVFAYGITAPTGTKPGWGILNFYGWMEFFVRILYSGT